MKISDKQIRAVIAELRAQGMRPSGARVRRELRTRFGSPGGVTHIYRVLREAPAMDPGRAKALEAEAAEAQERAARAEAREDAQQLYWAREIDGLRQQVKQLEHAQAEAVRWQRACERLAMELRAAQMKAGEVEG